jgi:hypothetical protein
MTEHKKQVSATMGGFTPSFDCVIQDVGLVGAAVFGRVWRYCQGSRGICDASIETIAGSLNLSTRTVLRWTKALCKAGYLEDLTPKLRNKPHTYRDTGKVSLQVQIVAMTKSHTTEEGKPPAMTESHSAMTESHSRYDLKSHEESIKRQEKRKKESPSGDDLPIPTTPPTDETESFDDLWSNSPVGKEEEAPRQEQPPPKESILSIKDPLAMAAECKRRRPNGVPDWAMGADGPDPYWDVLKAFCTITKCPLEEVKEKEGKPWLRQFAEIGDGDIDPALMARATAVLPAVQGVKWYLDNHKWTSPYSKSYIEQLKALARRMRAGLRVQQEGHVVIANDW